MGPDVHKFVQTFVVSVQELSLTMTLVSVYISLVPRPFSQLKISRRLGVTSWDWVKRVPPQPRLSPLEANHRASFETFDAVLAYTATTIVNSVRVYFFTVASLSWRVSVNIHARSSVYKLRLEVCFICPTVLYLPQLCYICPWLAEYSTVVSTPETGYS